MNMSTLIIPPDTNNSYVSFLNHHFILVPCSKILFLNNTVFIVYQPEYIFKSEVFVVVHNNYTCTCDSQQYNLDKRIWMEQISSGLVLFPAGRCTGSNIVIIKARVKQCGLKQYHLGLCIVTLFIYRDTAGESFKWTEVGYLKTK